MFIDSGIDVFIGPEHMRSIKNSSHPLNLNILQETFAIPPLGKGQCDIHRVESNVKLSVVPIVF